MNQEMSIFSERITELLKEAEKKKKAALEAAEAKKAAAKA